MRTNPGPPVALANMREEAQPILSNANGAEAEKAAQEIRVFREFVERSGLLIDPTTVQNRPPPEPDIRCVAAGEGPVAFELVELCNPELAKDIGDQIKRGTSAKFLMLDDPGPAAFATQIEQRLSDRRSDRTRLLYGSNCGPRRLQPKHAP
jgi:hypothetical protein